MSEERKSIEIRAPLARADRMFEKLVDEGHEFEVVPIAVEELRR